MVSDEFLKFFDKLKHRACLAKHHPKILSHLNDAIKQTMEGKIRLTQEALESLYQCVGLILAFKPTGMAVRLSVLQVYERIVKDNRNIMD